MPSATLTAASPTTTFDTVAGTLYTLGCTGHLGGAAILLEVALTDTATIFTELDTLPRCGGSEYRAVGSKLRATLSHPDPSASLTVALTPAV